MKLTKNSKSFEPCPEYTGQAICVDITPLKKVETSYGPKETFRAVFETKLLREDGTPFGWIDADGVDLHRNGSPLYDSVTAGGSLFHPDATLREALDAALSSPSGIGVAVDDTGAVLGGFPADQVIDALDDQRRAAG